MTEHLNTYGRWKNNLEVLTMSNMDDQWRHTLRAAMRDRHISQEQLAERLGISQGAVSKWLRGKAAPEDSRWPDIAAAVGLTTVQLLFGTGTGAKMRKLMSIAEGLSEAELDAVIASAQVFEKHKKDGEQG